MREIEERIRDIESRQSLIIDSILQLIDKLELSYDSFSILSLVSGFSSREIEIIEYIFGICAAKSLDYDSLLNMFKDKMPSRVDMLLSIANGLYAENKFIYSCKLVIDKIGVSETRKADKQA